MHSSSHFVEKRDLSERDICTKLITPAILQAGWTQEQFREEVKLTPGRVVVRGKVAQRVKDPEAQGGPKRSDYVLYAKPNALVSLKLSQRRLDQRTEATQLRHCIHNDSKFVSPNKITIT